MKIRTNALEPQWILVFAFFAAGAFFGALGIYLWFNTNTQGLVKFHPASNEYKYVNPLLAVDIAEGGQFAQNLALQLKLQGLIDTRKNNRAITSAAVYFRDIELGAWVGINEGDLFSPGKLLKIPIMIAYFKLAEDDPTILERELTFSQANQPRVAQIFPVTESLTDGHSYTVDNLIRRMIVDSDDNAANLLFDDVDKPTLNAVFSDLGINFKEDKDTADFVALKTYALFLRILYNGSYLNRTGSEKALQLLVDADNSIGIAAGLPNDIATANRYGGRPYTNEQGIPSYEMYDCGLIYYTAHPYIVCAVVRGRQLSDLKTFLRDVGRVVYDEVSYEYKPSP